MARKKPRLYKYHATGKHTVREEDIINGYYLEFNSSIGMYRCNHPDGVPHGLMGYEKHRDALMNKIKRWRQ